MCRAQRTTEFIREVLISEGADSGQMKKWFPYCNRSAVAKATGASNELSAIAPGVLNHSANTAENYRRDRVDQAVKVANFWQKQVGSAGTEGPTQKLRQLTVTEQFDRGEYGGELIANVPH
jgi:hypothetical protein